MNEKYLNIDGTEILNKNKKVGYNAQVGLEIFQKTITLSIVVRSKKRDTYDCREYNPRAIQHTYYNIGSFAAQPLTE